MRKTFTTAFLLLLSAAASAQVTLNQSSYSNMVITTDIFGRVTSGFPPMPVGTNQNYDMTQLTYYDTVHSDQYTGTHASFPGASFNEPRPYSLGSYKYIFNTKRWSGITAVGLERIGEEMPRQAISLFSSNVPGAAVGDSLIVNQQNVIYSASYPLVKFPASVGSKWTAKFDLVVDMVLTHVAAGYTNAPMQYKVTTEYEFECVGDGKCTVPFVDAPGVYGEDDVLMVRIGGTTVDSFFINGAPAGASILTTLGLLQNQTANNHWDELFRDNEVNALVLYSYGANVFTTPEVAKIHQLRVPFPVSVKSVSADGNMALYPNPVQAGGQVFVKLPQVKAGDYNYTISTVTGKVAAKGHANANGTASLPIALPASLSNGVYWLSLQHNGEVIGTAPFRYGE